MKADYDVPVLPLLTQQKRIRFLWIVMINFSWFIGLYTLFVIGTVLPFTLRRFTEDTRLIGLVTSVGLWMGIILGPLVNYTSDRIWTRFGRRRPFLLIATCGSLLASLCVPFIPSLTPLILLVVISSILGDVGCTQEPLWLEVIPPSQRGTAFAIRMMMINMASLLFFQIMFAQFDNRYTLPGGFILTGEQTCYLSAALLQTVYLILLAFFIREVRPDNANLRHLHEVRSEHLSRIIHGSFGKTKWWHYLLLSPLPAPIMLRLAEKPGLEWVNMMLFPWAFFLRFCRDVFCESRWWWVYLFYTTPTFVLAGSGFFTLMLVEQFHYTKPNIALSGVPVMILSLCVLTPFMAWYADRLPRFKPAILGGIMCGSLAGLIGFLHLCSHVPKLELPPFWIMMGMAILTELLAGAFVIGCFQTLRGFHPKTNPRLWAWMLGNTGAFLMALATYMTIKVFSADGVPSMTTWFVISHVAVGVSCLGIVAGPLLYDFIPKDKIGTLSSGFGLLNTALQAILSTLVGSWIYYVSKWTSHGATTKDYSTAYTMQITLGLITLTLVAVFVRRLLKGTMVEYGRLRLNSTDTAPETDAGKADHP